MIVALLAVWFAPLDIFDLLIITGLSFLTLLFFSGLFSCFAKSDFEILSRVSKGRLDPLIRAYEKLGSWSKSSDNSAT
jgi:hypothetical protein